MSSAARRQRQTKSEARQLAQEYNFKRKRRVYRRLELLGSSNLELVARRILNHIGPATDYTYAWLSVGKLAQLTRMSPRNVQRYLAVLRELDIFRTTLTPAARFRAECAERFDGYEPRTGPHPCVAVIEPGQHWIWDEAEPTTELIQVLASASAKFHSGRRRKDTAQENKSERGHARNGDAGVMVNGDAGVTLPQELTETVPHKFGTVSVSSSKPLPPAPGGGGSEVAGVVELLERVEKQAGLEPSRISYPRLAQELLALDLPAGWLEADLLEAVQSEELQRLDRRAWAVFLSDQDLGGNKPFRFRLQEEIMRAAERRQRQEKQEHLKTPAGVWESYSCKKFYARPVEDTLYCRLGLLVALLVIDGRLNPAAATVVPDSFGATLIIDTTVLTEQERELLARRWQKFQQRPVSLDYRQCENLAARLQDRQLASA